MLKQACDSFEHKCKPGQIYPCTHTSGLKFRLTCLYYYCDFFNIDYKLKLYKLHLPIFLSSFILQQFLKSKGILPSKSLILWYKEIFSYNYERCLIIYLKYLLEKAGLNDLHVATTPAKIVSKRHFKNQ